MILSLESDILSKSQHLLSTNKWKDIFCKLWDWTCLDTSLFLH